MSQFQTEQDKLTKSFNRQAVRVDRWVKSSLGCAGVYLATSSPVAAWAGAACVGAVVVEMAFTGRIFQLQNKLSHVAERARWNYERVMASILKGNKPS